VPYPDDPPVLHLEHAAAAGGEAGIMGDDEKGGAGSRLAFEQKVEDRGAGLDVEIAGGLVCEEQLGPRGGGAGDGDALLLAAGKLHRIMGEAVAEADRLELGRGDAEGVRLARQLERHRHVFVRGHGRQQVEGLEDDADPPLPRPRQPVLVELGEVRAGDANDPPVARSSPESTAIKEDFPEPEGPSKATLSPLATFRSMPRRMSTRASPVPSARVTFSASMT
jgi:hypothetical protein